MIASTSLSAFSVGAPSANAPARSPQVQPVRAQQAEPAGRQGTPALPESRPSLPPPRGTFVNLSV